MRKRMMGKLRKMSKTYYLRQIVACLLVYCILLAVPAQVALATIGDGGYSVVAGSANVSLTTPGYEALIDMLGDRAVINWNDFDTAAGQLAAFVKSSGGNFAVLNRIIGANPTLFNGNLWAPDGDVFIVNTRGIVFGPDSYLQARNLVASGIDIQNDNFMGGIYQFEKFPATPENPYSNVIGNVSNQGLLTGINAESVALIGKSVSNLGIIRTTAPDGAVVMAAGESVLLNEVGSNIVVEAITIPDPAEHIVTNAGIFAASSGNVGKVILAAGDIYSTAISGVDNLSASADRDIQLFDDIQVGEIVMEAGQDITLADTKTMDSDGELTLEADRNVILGGAVTAGGTMTLDAGVHMLAKSTLETTAGNIELSASDTTILLLDNVDAAADLKLHNTTVAGPGITLEAGQDVIVGDGTADGTTLTGVGALTVEADRHITLGGAVVASDTVAGDLILKADAGSLGGNMTAYGTITNTANGGGSIDIYSSDSTTLLYDNVSAGVDLNLHNDTWVADGKKLDAGQDVRVGDGTPDGTTLTGEGALTVEADQNITLGGAVVASDSSAGDLILKANAGGLGGNMTAYGTITNTANGGGSIDIYSSDTPFSTYLYDDVSAGVDLNLHNHTWAADEVKLEAGNDVHLDDNMFLAGAGNLTVEADNDVYLGGPVTTAGDMILTADKDGDSDGRLDVQSKLTTTNGGNIEMTAGSDPIEGGIHLNYNGVEPEVEADGNILLNSDTYAVDGVVLDAGQNVELAADKTLTGEGELTVNADENIVLGALDHGGDVITEGDLTLNAGDDIFAYGVLKTDTIDDSDGDGADIDLTASGDDTIHLFGDVTADLFDGGSIYLHNNTEVAGGVTLKAGLDVELDAGKTMTGAGPLTIESDRNIVLGGAVTAGGTMTLRADADKGELDYVPGGTMWAKSTLETTAGDIDIYAFDSTIDLDGDVTAAQDLILNNNTIAAADITLKAGNDVQSPAHLTAEGNLTIEATGGAITAHEIIMPAAPAPETTLTLTQNDKLDMEQNVKVLNRNNTHLVATSTADSVTSEAAAKWIDITAWAYENITLSDESGDITTLDLYAEEGDIKITAEDGKLYANGPIDAGRDVVITATDEDPDAIFLSGDVNADRDILLNNNTWAYDGAWIDAGQDVIVGDGTADGTTLTGEGELNVEADRHITLGGAVAASDGTPGDLLLKADAGSLGGDMTAYSTITNLGGSIDIYSSDTTTYLHDNVTASVDLNLHNGTWVADDKKLDAGQDVIVGDGTADGTTLTGEGDLEVEADRHITLGGAVVASDSSAGNLILEADAGNLGGDMTAYSTITNTANGGGSIDIYSSDTTTYLHDDVSAGVDIILHNDTEADADVVLNAGDDVVLVDGKTLDGLGALTVQAGDDVMFGVAAATHEADPATGTAGDVSADGTLIVDAGDSVYAHGNITTTSGGDIEIYSSDTTTYLYGDYINADGSVLLNNTTESYGDIIAGEDVTLNGTLELKGTGPDADQEVTATNGKLLANDWVSKTSEGNLDMFGGFNGPLGAGDYSVKTKEVTVDDGATDGELSVTGNAFVWLDGDIYSRGDMTLASNVDADIIGSDAGYMHHDSGTIESLNGDVDISASGSWIHLYGGNPTDYVTAGGDILLRDSTYVIGDRKLEAGDDVVLAGGKYLSYYGAPGALTVEAGDDIIFGVDDIATHETTQAVGTAGDVTVDGDLILTAGDDIYAHGKLSTEPGSGGAITATAEDHINLYNTPTSADADGTLTLIADNDDDDTGDLTVEGDLYGNMYLSGYDLTVNGDITSYGPLTVDSDYRVTLNGTVEAQDDITITVEGGDEAYVYAADTIKSLAGSIDISAVTTNDPSYDAEIDLDGDVEAYGNLSLFADTTEYDAYIYTEGLKTLNGDIDVFSDYDMYLNGPVEAYGNMILTAGNDGDDLWAYGDVYAYDTLKSVTGDITINSSYGVELYDAVEAYGNVSIINRQPYYVDCYVWSDSDATITALTGDVSITTDYYMELEGDISAQGNITLIADGPVGLEDPPDPIEDNDGYIYIDAGLTTTTGNISASAEYDVTVNGNVQSGGTLDVYADEGDIELRADVSSVGEMTMNAGNDISLNEDSGDTTSGGNMTLIAGKTNNWGDVEAWGTLRTTDAENGDLTVMAADNIRLHAPTSADAAGELQLHADTDNDPDGGDVVVDGALYGNMTITGVNAYVSGDVESDGTLDVDVDNDVELRANVSSVGEMTIDAGNDIKLNEDSGDTTANDNMTLTAGEDVYAYGKLTTLDGSGGSIHIYSSDDTTHLYDDVTADLTDDGDVFLHNDTWVADGVTIMAGRDVIAGEYSTDCPSGHIDGDGDLTINAGRDITAYGKVEADGTLTMDAVGDISVYRRIYAGGFLDMEAVNITVGDFVEEIGGFVEGYDGVDVYAENDFMSRCGIESYYGYINMEAGNDIYAGGYVNAGTSIDMLAGNNISLGKYVQSNDGHLYLTATEGSITVGALERDSDYPVHKGGPLYAYEGDMVLNAGEDISIKKATVHNGSMIMDAGNDILVGGMVIDDYDDETPLYLDKGGRLEVTVDEYFGGTEMTLTAGRDISFKSALVEHGDLTATAERDVILRGDVTDNCYYDEVVESSNGNVYLHSLGGDVSIAEGYEILGGELGFHEVGEGEWEAHGGGVSIIADEGKIYSPGGDDDTLNVTIEGSSSQADGIGVELPLDPEQKAAIVLISKEDLKLGDGASLSAYGEYDNTGAVDDRAAVGFVDAPDTYIPLPPGDLLRDEGDPFDAAIYVASTDGDVDVSSPVSIMSGGEDDGPPPVPQGAMIVDAWDSVTFGSLFEDSLANGDVGDRLEVVSRIVEWLYQAVGRLPYPYGGGPFPFDYTYVLRGAGLGNPDITDGRAWVLVDPLEAAPLSREAGQAAEDQALGLDGCPVLLAAASAELGIPGDTIEVSLANSYALNTDIQPCETCARLVNAAAILADADGSAMAAMNQVFNELAPAGAPYTPEMATSIVTAFAGRVNDGTQYATAIEYIDAFVNYIAVLDSEMGSPVDDSVAFAMQKYGSGITGSDNANMAAFLAARLEAGETFGQ